MVKRKRMWMIALCALALVCADGRTVSAGNESSVTNHIATGIVDIELEEYQIRNGKEVKWQDNPLILPGANISKIPRIYNHGSDCYVRAKITFQGISVNLEKDIYGMGSGWVKKSDGYYYYTEVLKTDENIDLFKGIQIPTDFPQETESSVFSLDLSVDAIQSQNFNPDFSAAQPWGQVQIMECEKQGPYTVTSLAPGEGKIFLIEYQGESEELFINEEDFFGNFSTFMPGDVYSDSARISNNSGKDMELYFRSEIFEEQDLLEEIQLLITVEMDGKEKMLYKGPLKAESLSQNRLLAEIPRSSQAQLNFTVTVPEELDNAYAAEESQVKWIFLTKTETTGIQSVRTGDDKNPVIFLAAAGVSLGVIVIGVMRKRRHEKNHQSNG